jgi:hypothetical protein
VNGLDGRSLTLATYLDGFRSSVLRSGYGLDQTASEELPQIAGKYHASTYPITVNEVSSLSMQEQVVTAVIFRPEGPTGIRPVLGGLAQCCQMSLSARRTRPECGKLPLASLALLEKGLGTRS